jgi:hypothetical protein
VLPARALFASDARFPPSAPGIVDTMVRRGARGVDLPAGEPPNHRGRRFRPPFVSRDSRATAQVATGVGAQGIDALSGASKRAGVQSLKAGLERAMPSLAPLADAVARRLSKGLALGRQSARVAGKGHGFGPR